MLYFLRFSGFVLYKAVYILVQRNFETRRAYKLLDELEEQFAGKFNAATKRKIAVSYGIYNPMICDTFCQIHGKNTSIAEKERFIHYFICSSVFDDFTDYEIITAENLYKISFLAEDYTPITFDEKIFKYAHLYLKNSVKDKASYLKVNEAIYQAQLESKQQQHTTLPINSIQKITFKKGGNSLLLCCYYLDKKCSEAEQDCWYAIGKIIQLINDLFDIWKDLQDDITTVPNSITDITAFELLFSTLITEVKNSIKKLPIAERRKEKLSISLAGIYSFGLIAIAQLKPHFATKEISLKQLPRKALIVDMEKPINLLRWIKYTFKYGHL